MDFYSAIGYPVVECSAKNTKNVAHVVSLLTDRISIVVGQSGVGKSSLINAMIAEDSLRVGDLSTSSGEGKHTTVNSALLPLPNGGGVIDSPGVRDYAPALDRMSDVRGRVSRGFGSSPGMQVCQLSAFARTRLRSKVGRVAWHNYSAPL